VQWATPGPVLLELLVLLLVVHVVMVVVGVQEKQLHAARVHPP
jgi:hypothetical protein